MICKGIHPFSFQKDVIDEVVNAKGTGKIVVVKSRRQVGKSTLIANLLLYYSINYAGTKNYCLSPTLKQGKKLYKTVIKALTQAKFVKAANGSDLSIVLKNESEINFKSAEQYEALRGETCTGLLAIDEMAYISDDVYDIIKPWCDFHKAVTLMVSSPFVKQGYFWTYYNYGLERSHNCVSIDWADEKYQEDLDKILPPERLEEYRTILPKKVYMTEYQGLFIDGGGLVFDFFREAQKTVQMKPTDKYYIGIDWSNQAEKDYTAISVLNQNCQQVKLVYFNNLTPLKQIERVVQELSALLPQTVVICCESNSIGTPYNDMLKDRLQTPYKSRLQGFVTSNQSKNDLVAKMQVALEQGTISLLPDKKQEREFGYYAAEYNPTTKNVSYNAPSGLNDDTVIASLLSLYAYNNFKAKGQYCFGSFGVDSGMRKYGGRNNNDDE